MPRTQAWVVYPDGVDRVEIVRRGGAASQMVREVEDPVTVEDDEGCKFVVPFASLFNDPVSASIAQVELRKRLGMPLDAEEEEEQEDQEEEDEEEDEDEEEEEEED